MSLNAKDSVAVITGGSSGVGLAVAKELIKAGAKGIVITGRTQPRLDDAVRTLSELGGINTKIVGSATDALTWEGNVEVMKLANDTFGQIDYVFLNATGIERGVPFNLLGKPDFEPTYTQFNSAMFGVNAAASYLASPNSNPVTEAGGEKPKRDRAIIFTGSDGAFNGSDMAVHYCIGKGALLSFVTSAQHALKDLGIRVGIVVPAFMLTGLWEGYEAVGALTADDFIPLETVAGAFMRIVNDSSLTGVVTRIPNPHTKPFDVQAEILYKGTTAFWKKFASEQASEAGDNKDN